MNIRMKLPIGIFRRMSSKIYVSRLYKVNGSTVALCAFVKDEFAGWGPFGGLLEKHGIRSTGING